MLQPNWSRTAASSSPLDPVTHRNTSFQPLPRPLGLAPYHFDLAAHFPDIAQAIKGAGKLVFHVVGDTGGTQDAEFQDNVAENAVASSGSELGGVMPWCGIVRHG
jgi:hypothetical protein